MNENTTKTKLQEYGEIIYNLEPEIVLLEVLMDDIVIFKHALETLANPNPEAIVEAKEDLNIAISEYNRQKDDLLIKLEAWMKFITENNYPININYFRILQELRTLKRMGI